MELDKIKIGTRGSPLALWQATWIQSLLENANPGLLVELVKIKTSGDKIQDVSLAKIGGKGLFTKEIEESLIRKDTDIAVHSMKDVPVSLPRGLEIAVITQREDPRDALISKDNIKLADLPQGAKIGTGSLRRQTQLLSYRPDFNIVPLRGNLDTRLNKLETEGLDAIILAAAGLKRLGMEDRISECIDPDIMLPGIGQGAVGIQLRLNDSFAIMMTMNLDDELTHTALLAERAFLRKLEGGCQVPIGGYATIEDDVLTLKGMVGSLDGKKTIRAEKSGEPQDAEYIGKKLGEEILLMGADKILEEVYSQ
jgi:hydroxymethylbilane synthase